MTVVCPPNLSEDVIRPKEQALIELVRTERAKGRKVWVYVQFTDKHDVQGRLDKLLRQEGFQVEVLRASVALAKREEWIATHAPQLDVVISHPRLVETGLDLFRFGDAPIFEALYQDRVEVDGVLVQQAGRTVVPGGDR